MKLNAPRGVDDREGRLHQFVFTSGLPGFLGPQKILTTSDFLILFLRLITAI
jgi:hypothetical protein